MDDLFGPGGRLDQVLPGYEARAEQAMLASAVETALASGEHLVAEAGTGTGKSLAYLIPALDCGRRVVVSTATKALQEQLLAKDVPVAAAVLGREVEVAVLKGRQNYLCRNALQGFALLGGQLFDRPADAAAFDAMRGWIDATETGDRAELDVEPPEVVWGEIAVGADRCLGRLCAFAGTCFSEAARERASHAELVITNHALYFADLGLRSRTDAPAVLPEHDAVVFDEAHRLEESAATWLGGRVSASVLHRLLRDVDRACREAALPVPARALDRVEAAGLRLLASVAPPAGRRRIREVPAEPAEALADRLAELAAALTGKKDEVDAVARRALRLAVDVRVCLEPDANRVVWAERDLLAWAPVDVAPVLEELLWDAGPTAVLVSATLSAGEDFAFVRRRLGLRDARELAVGSPYDYRSQALLYLPRGLPDPRADDALARAVEEIAALCRISSGRALVLTSSYRALSAIADGIRSRVPFEVLAQGEAPRERLLERFRSEVDSVLVATSTFWQGIDVPGESLSLLVIHKLPFAAPGEPLVEARCERIDADGGDWFREYSLPSAVLQLRQGFGRLIRSHSDRGVIAILDPRVRSQPYGRAFLESLPPCPVAFERSAVTDFFAEGALLIA
ncbi:MAG TPA: ATP-dependent DNA helicase [Gaiellaceae bacterium]|nr:ATP-dependent DNA helicase [Gaiellaceae bacterium]